MRTLLLYVVLVALPVAGVLAVLHVGEGLSAPRAVSGLWEVHSDVPAGCPWAEGLGPRLRVEQSGERLTVFGRRGQLRGRLLGDSLRVERDGDGSCQTLVMTAALEGGAVAEALAGRIEAPGCAACPDVPFRAQRIREE